jgi:hypothetical protein
MVSKRYPKQVASRVKFDSQRELLLHRSFLKPQIGKKKISFWYNSQLGVQPFCNADLSKEHNLSFNSIKKFSLSLFYSCYYCDGLSSNKLKISFKFE